VGKDFSTILLATATPFLEADVLPEAG